MNGVNGVNGVNATSDGADRPYHHHNLPAALRAAAAELIGAHGPSGFSLRAVAREAGVSHAAPAHHFGDTRGLLTSLATEGFDHLTAALADASREPDAEQRLRRCGSAYVKTALIWPGHFAVIFRNDLLNEDDPALLESGTAAMAQLIGAIEALRDEMNPDLDVDAAAIMCWATMQGLVTLAPTLGHIDDRPQPALDELVGLMCSAMLDGFRPRPTTH